MSSIKISDTNELLAIYNNFQAHYNKYYDFKEDDIYCFIYEYVGYLTYNETIDELKEINDEIIKYLKNEFIKQRNECLKKKAYHIIMNYICNKFGLQL